MRSRLTMGDAAREVWIDLRSRPGRSAMTALGTLIGVAILVSTVGLAASLAAQINSRFDALTSTILTVSPVQADSQPSETLPTDAAQRVMQIHGTLAAATLSQLDTVTSVTGTPGYDPTATLDTGITVYAATPGLPDVIQSRVTGMFFNPWHDTNAVPVAVIGLGAAQRLRISDLSKQPVVLLDGQPFVIVGVLTAAQGGPNLLQSIIVPQNYAATRLGLARPSQLIVRTAVGAADIVGRQVSLAVRPELPDSLNVQIPPSPETTRRGITGDTQTLFLALGVISLVIGGVGIANMIMVSVMERTTEIGLRRALGARRRHILIQFLLSSAVVGLVGGVCGAAVGMMVTSGTALMQGWPSTMPPAVPFLSPIVGALIGVASGVYPAFRASRIEPVDALRAAN